MTVRRLWNRLLALVLVALPLFAATWVTGAWLRDAHAMMSAETARGRLTLQRYEDILERRPETERAVVRSSDNMRNYYWPGATAADAAAELQNQLATLIDAAGGEVRQFEVLAATVNEAHDEAHTAINLRVAVQATATQLLEALYSIERFRPYLFVDQLHVRTPDRPRPAQAGEAVLQVSMDLHGYLEPNLAQSAQ